MRYCFKDLIKKRGLGKIVGTWVDGNLPIIAELAGLVGYDFLVIDNEHGCHGNPNVLECVRGGELTGMPVFFRVPNQFDEEPIKKALDMGASGIIVPNVSSKEEAQRVVNFSKFAPIGNRGCCPLVRTNDYTMKYGWQEYFKKANEETITCLLIETANAVRDIDEILSVPGVDMIQIGRVDMSVSMGLEGNFKHPDVIAGVEKVIKSAREHNIIVGITGFNRQDAMELAQTGKYDVITVGDTATIAAAMREDLNCVRECLE